MLSNALNTCLKIILGIFIFKELTADICTTSPGCEQHANMIVPVGVRPLASLKGATTTPL